MTGHHCRKTNSKPVGRPGKPSNLTSQLVRRLTSDGHRRSDQNALGTPDERHDTAATDHPASSGWTTWVLLEGTSVAPGDVRHAHRVIPYPFHAHSVSPFLDEREQVAAQWKTPRKYTAELLLGVPSQELLIAFASLASGLPRRRSG